MEYEINNKAVTWKGKLAESVALSGQRRRKMNLAQRRRALEDDQWTLDVEEEQVKCKGCRNWVKLRAGRKYELNDWDKHKTACKQVTGVETVRTAGQKKQRFSEVRIRLYFKGRSLTYHLLASMWRTITSRNGFFPYRCRKPAICATSRSR
jgi:hypothetical protein